MPVNVSFNGQQYTSFDICYLYYAPPRAIAIEKPLFLARSSLDALADDGKRVEGEGTAAVSSLPRKRRRSMLAAAEAGQGGTSERGGTVAVTKPPPEVRGLVKHKGLYFGSEHSSLPRLPNSQLHHIYGPVSGGTSVSMRVLGVPRRSHCYVRFKCIRQHAACGIVKSLKMVSVVRGTVAFHDSGKGDDGDKGEEEEKKGVPSKGEKFDFSSSKRKASASSTFSSSSSSSSSSSADDTNVVGLATITCTSPAMSANVYLALMELSFNGQEFHSGCATRNGKGTLCSTLFEYHPTISQNYTMEPKSCPRMKVSSMKISLPLSTKFQSIYPSSNGHTKCKIKLSNEMFVETTASSFSNSNPRVRGTLANLRATNGGSRKQTMRQ